MLSFKVLLRCHVENPQVRELRARWATKLQEGHVDPAQVVLTQTFRHGKLHFAKDLPERLQVPRMISRTGGLKRYKAWARGRLSEG